VKLQLDKKAAFNSDKMLIKKISIIPRENNLLYPGRKVASIKKLRKGKRKSQNIVRSKILDY
jgi:hypothetical protein